MTNSLGIARELLQLASRQGLWIVTAESLTGGMIAAQLAAVPGASKVLLGGVICYQDSVKTGLLDVPLALLEKHGAVSAQVAQQLAVGVRNRYATATHIEHERLVAVSATGVAGPESVGQHLPGEVYVGVCSATRSGAERFRFSGERNRVREMAVRAALAVLREDLRKL